MVTPKFIFAHTPNMNMAISNVLFMWNAIHLSQLLFSMRNAKLSSVITPDIAYKPAPKMAQAIMIAT